MKSYLKNHRYWQKTTQIMKLRDQFAELSDDEIKAKTKKLQRQYQQGTSLNSLLVQAYALVCVADERVLGLRPFKVQIFGAVAMHYNNVIEMKTGEGKTLTATMVMFLHGLTGPGNFLVTANSYLAKRDATNMGRVYRWLGLTVSYNSEDATDNEQKQEIYQADIVYTDSGTFGFDYLTNNLVSTTEKQFMPLFKFALIDEVDAVLLDLASTPLVISGRPKGQSNYPKLADTFIKTAKEKRDFAYSKDRKKVWFLKTGIKRASEFYGVPNILAQKYADIYRYLYLALKANYVLKRDQDYLVDNGKIVLIDDNNGRKMNGMQLQAGLHQAIEVKEGLEVTPQQQAIATITYQNLFRMFASLAGMTGTASTDRSELMRIYNLAVVQVPTNKESIREDKPDQIFFTNKAKLLSSLKLVKQNHEKGRPILIETGSLELSNLYSDLLFREHIPHNLLNARSVVQESAMIAVAGQVGMVTVSTSMAGRGTDIVLSDEAKKLGGLLVIGTERMSIKRIDNQLRGRAGRQGQPGTTIFYTSLQDQLVNKFPSSRISKAIRRHEKQSVQQITGHLRYQHLFDNLQKNVAHQNESSRFMTLQYGEIMRLQREAVYHARAQVMEEYQDLDELVITNSEQAIDNFAVEDNLQTATIMDYLLENIDPEFVTQININHSSSYQQELKKIMLAALDKKKKQFKNQEAWHYYEKLTILKAIDDSWVTQVDTLETLRVETEQKTTGQSNPMYQYQTDALNSFIKMRQDIAQRVMRNVLCSDTDGSSDEGMQIYFA